MKFFYLVSVVFSFSFNKSIIEGEIRLVNEFDVSLYHLSGIRLYNIKAQIL